MCPPLVPDRKGGTKAVSRFNVLTPPGSKGALSCCWTKRAMHVVGEMGFRASVLLNVELVERQFVHKGSYQVVCGEVEDQPKKYGDGERGEGFLEDGQEQESQTEADKYGHETGQRRIPVSVRRGLSHQHTVEDEVPKSQLHTPLFVVIVWWWSRGRHLLYLSACLVCGLEGAQLVLLVTDPV